jgi:hypothetical protein
MKRDCACPRAQHRHGTPQAYNRCACRCGDCTDAIRQHHRDARRRAAHNKWATTPNPTWLDRTGTIRRIQALAAIGWSLSAQGKLLGLTPYGVTAILAATNRTRIRYDTAQQIRHLYNQLAGTPAPQHTRSQRISAQRAIAHARRQGWASPLAWNDIDNPNERPQGALRMVRRAA